MVPVLFPGLPGGVELLVILLIMIILLGLPLFLLVVGGFGFWKLSRGDGASDDETVEELRRRVDDLESRVPADGGERDDDSTTPVVDADTDTPSGDPDDDREGR